MPAAYEETPRGAESSATNLRSAVRLFNDAEYHAAHEVLDELWEGTSGADSDFYKGVIQACIAMHHFARGNLAGARKLYSGHRAYLAAYLPQHLGLDVAGLLDEMQRTLRPVLRARAGEDVRFDSEQRPRMVFATGADE